MENHKSLNEKELADKFLKLVENLDYEPDGVSVNIMMELGKHKNLSKQMKEIDEMAEEIASLWIPYDEENREKARKLFIELGDKLTKIVNKS
jgi:hypothetical protein